MALDFTVTTSTTAIAAGTPSRAISLTLTGSGTLGSTASFALSDGGASGAFYPASPATLAGGSGSGAVIQVVYIPATGASGTITLQAICTGGLSATHTLALPIVTNATVFLHDSFTGSASTALTAHSPNTGGTWALQSVAGSHVADGIATLDGSGHLYNSVAGQSAATYVNSAAAATTEFDVSADLIVNDTTTLTAPALWADPTSGETTLDGYFLQLFNNGGSPAWATAVFVGGNPTIFYNADSPAISAGTYHCLTATRTINSLQYIFFIANGSLVGSTVGQDGTQTSKLAGLTVQTQSGSTQTGSNGVTFANLFGRNVDWSAAQSLSFSGPSSGITGSASTNFTVTANLSGSDTVTPHSDTGGTFSPTSLTFSSGSSSQTFTYTPALDGAHSISITDSSSASISGSPITYTSSASPVIVTFPDARVYQSPYTWRNASGAAIAPTAGPYLKFTVSGTTQILANVDTTLNAAQASNGMPSIKVLVNPPTADGVYSFVLFPANNTASTQITLATGLSTGTTYNVILSMIGGDTNGGLNGWSATDYQTKINSLQFDGGAIVTAPTTRSKNALFFGASYESAYFGGTETGAWYNFVDFTLSWPFAVSWAFGCEYGQIGIGSQGWVEAGQGGYPAFPSSWNHYDSTHAKTFSPAPDYVFVHQAENDKSQSSGTITTAVTNWIAAARTAFGAGTKIFIILSLPQIQSAAIKSGVTAANDANTFVLDPGSEFADATFNGTLSATWMSPDGLHLDANHQSGLFGSFVSKQAQAAISGSGGGSNTVFSPIGSGFIRGA